MRYTNIAADAPRLFGTHRLRLAPIGPTHTDALISLVAACSPESRFARFHTGMADLRPAMAAHLADIDPADGAAFGLWTRRGRLIAEARYQRTGNAVAEAAILVADPHQSQRLGLNLLAVTFQHAADHGLLALHAEVLASNEAIIGLLSKLADVHTVGYSQGSRLICVPLTDGVCPDCGVATARPSFASRR